MRTDTYKSEAEECRRQATVFSGKPEGAFLLRLAGMFDQLAADEEPRFQPDRSGCTFFTGESHVPA